MDKSTSHIWLACEPRYPLRLQAARPRVKNKNAVHLSYGIESRNHLALLILSRIPPRRHHHAHRRFGVPPYFGFGQLTIYDRFQEVQEIGFQAHEDGLRFRITEAAVELQDLGTASR